MASDKRESISLDVVIAEFEKSTDIPIERVKEWMQSESLEVLGAVYSLITDESRHYLRIKPNLSREDYFEFIMKYLERCMLEDSAGEWADSRYAAGRSVVNWFVHFWRDADAPQITTVGLKDWLAKLYKEGNEELRLAIITATLEHLFEYDDIEGFFGDWLADPILRLAYDEAREYARALKKENL